MNDFDLQFTAREAITDHPCFGYDEQCALCLAWSKATFTDLAGGAVALLVPAWAGGPTTTANAIYLCRHCVSKWQPGVDLLAQPYPQIIDPVGAWNTLGLRRAAVVSVMDLLVDLPMSASLSYTRGTSPSG